MEGGRIVQSGAPEDIVLRPADDYVANSSHMNPLNVLRGGSLMTPAASLRRIDNEVMLDRNGRVCAPARRRGQADRGHPRWKRRRHRDRRTARQARWRRGLRTSICHCADRLEDALGDRAAEPSGNPIVLVDDLGRMAGLCGDDEIYRALLQQRRAAEGA